MTVFERKMKNMENEIRKLTRAKERHERRFEKRISACEKNKCNWTRDEFLTHMTDMTRKQWVAYFNMFCEQIKVADLNSRLKKAEKRLESIMPKPDDLAGNIGM